MAAFAKGVYDAAAYSAFRPVYPRRLFDKLWEYHAASGRPDLRWQRAVDLGCGTGQATVVIAERFGETIGVDPSPNMVSQATKQLTGQYITPYVSTSGRTTEAVPAETRIRYHQSPAENLSFLNDNSVDFAGAAQAIHWFDYGKLWKELGRVLKPGGTAAFWGYSEMRIKGFPSLTPLITYYSQGSNPIDPQRVATGEKVSPERDSLSAYWEQPGRSILNFGLTAVPAPPAETFDSIESKVIAFTGDYRDDIVQRYRKLGRNVEANECVLDRPMNWTLLDKYCRTWISLSNYRDAHPELADEQPDIVNRFLERLREEMQRATGSVPETFVVEWPTTVLLFRKRG
ncbi:hypothetical protein M408DRAFT_331571 [Serendipita vermifera MAFF 305830]|uniref:Methyltransferase type 11 domain-containing protein n=1 Tax=Serendipita vermifera MAFF 305830 TaxID=933852 RepID=A0A0C2WEM1_SERVB|nr:hypothetical protein M408DRAFT_331571 [Serendipita vermifera MAFF 305830]